MVFVKQIILRNFKSFGGSAKLSFAPGFTVITGPNGSGKSNILDAFQFVLGELGSKRMRVQSFSGLIYEGATSEEKGSFAQVVIRLDNSDGKIPIDEKTISIGRRVDVQGKSRYFLNGKSVSRKTMINVLGMVGISAEGYNIVLQGTSTRLSDITPEERMRAIETLIGIQEYDDKKTEATKRLDEAERKVEIAYARIDEVRKRLIELERERNDALRHGFLREQEKAYHAKKLSLELVATGTRLREVGQRIAQTNSSLDEIEADRQRLIGQREEARKDLESYNQEVSDKGNTRLPLVKSEIVRLKEYIGTLTRRLREIGEKSQALTLEREQRLAEAGRLEEEMKEAQAGLEAVNRELEGIQAETSEKEANRLLILQQVSSIRHELEQSQKLVEELSEKLKPVEESLEGLEIEINVNKATGDTLREKLEDLIGKQAEQTRALENSKQNLSKFEEMKVGEEKKIEEFLRDLNSRLERQKNLRKRVEEAGTLTDDVEKTILEFSAKRDLWKRIAIEEKALQRIMEMGKMGAIQGYHGVLRDLIDVNREHQRAVATSSSGWLNAIVVSDLTAAMQCVKSLKKNELGMVHIIPIEEIPPKRRVKTTSDEHAVAITGVIKTDEKYSPITDMVWGDTFIVKEPDIGIRLSKQGLRAVTLAGDVYEPTGGLIGGYYRSSPDFSRLVPSEESVSNLSKTIRTLKNRLNTRMSDLKISGDDLKKLDQYIEQSTRAARTISDNLEVFSEELRRAERNASIMSKKIDQTRDELAKKEENAASLSERKAVAEQEVSRLRSEITQLEARKPSDLAGLEAQAAQADSELASGRMRLDELQKEHLLLRGRLENIIKPRILEHRQRIVAIDEALRSLDGEKRETESESATDKESLSQCERALGELTKEVQSTGTVLQSHQNRIARLESELLRIDQRARDTEKERYGLNLNQERVRLHSDQVREELLRLGKQETTDEASQDPEEIERVLKMVRAELESLGYVNQLAVTRYEQQMTDYRLLSVRINELEKEKGSILRFIEDIDNEKLKHFMSSFNQICENFSDFFSRLTGGGEGRLEFQNPREPFSAGIDLFVQFPGKPMRLVSGHSGGERSVAAIAYLLALQKFLRAPFYLFDEIDAHLDDFNVDRLAEVLRDNSETAQFIVITLKDAMVSTAQQVQGCFSRSGRSRIVSLPKIEVTH